ncbi:MotA/TolQ/ExbB proton channel family protein [Janthinobacterium agaricidamnosum]|uniref:Biopolymer transport protein ExbB n=1 Tax=Janthinobacterium agaricidamnosum NBRC 102515 = DSM 9628 TaxID=1349767 RepID=W0UX30_9BURK|nr:MotA/TolQ/ExbB proton channel family protein [Janthinobacterium agaricidamnosum]CDG81059.1 motA/TolQ/ExbB proton channel family protein [Janthinobacterium agaricidamnosum NBRC 102515 = DSM 9628]
MNPAPGHPFSLAQYWAQGDAISHAVAWLLLCMSLASWYLIFAKSWSAWRIRRSAGTLDAFWDAPGLDDGLVVLGLTDKEKIYLPLAVQGAALSQRGAGTLGAGLERDEQLTQVLRLALHRSTQRLESGLAVLASIGATAPFVGLLGTVWGIYRALASLSGRGAAQLEHLVGPVGEALIMTAIGLTVAIPAVLAYNGLQRVNRLTLAELDAFAFDLHACLRSANQRP